MWQRLTSVEATADSIIDVGNILHEATTRLRSQKPSVNAPGKLIVAIQIENRLVDAPVQQKGMAI